MITQDDSGIWFEDRATGETGYLVPIGWTPQMVPKRKPLTTPDLDAQAAKAEGVEGGKRGHIVFQGIPVCIENPVGSVRSGTDPAGTRWAVTMRHHYGFCKRTVGADGDGVDCFIGPDLEANGVYIVNQVDPRTRLFDEHKVMLGFGSEEEARQAYNDNFTRGWTGFHSIARHTVDDFKDWLQDETATRSIAKGGDGKKDYPPLHPGDHFISMGHGGEHHTFLIHMKEGSNVGRVIGGGGGKLNGLRLNKLDPAKWKEKSKESAKARREAEKKRQGGLTTEEQAKEKGAADEARSVKKQAEKDYIKSVLGSATGGQGGEHDDLFAEHDPKEDAETHRALLREAKKVAGEARKKVLLDAEARGANGMALVGGDAPLDLDQILAETQGKGGPGYDQKLAERAEKAGMTSEKLMAQVNEIREAGGKAAKAEKGPIDPAEQAANIAVHKATKDLAAQKAGAYREAIKASLENNQNLRAILEADAKLRDAYKAQLAKKKGITFEPGFQMATSEPAEHEALIQSLHEQLLTGHIRGFLEEVGEAYPDGAEIDPFKSNDMEGMHQSRGAGAFDLLHDVGLAALGQGIIDRDVVECLGPEGAAHVVARAIRHNFSHEDQQHVLAALEHHHLDEQEKILPQVTEDAQSLRAQAAEYDQQLVEVAHDLPAAIEIQKNKVEALKEARRLLGGALGRMEARAALIAALQGTPQNEYSMPLGKITPEKAVLTAAALGMKEGTYTIHHEEGEAVLTAKGEAMDALAKPVDAVALGEREVALSIKGGQQDEDNYLPAGFANRLADRYSNETLEPAQFQRHAEVAEGDDAEAVKGKLQAWMGAKLADGERPEDIIGLAYGGAKLGLPPGAQAHWEAALSEMVPLRIADKDAQGKPIQEKDKATGKPLVDPSGKPIYRMRMRAPHEIAAALEPMMQGYMKANPKEAGETLQGQRVDDDGNFHEALHRAIAEDPRMAAAYIPQGELTHDHASAIRDFFYKEHFGGKANSDEAKRWKFDQAMGALGPEPPELHKEAASVNLFADLDEDDAAGAEGAKSDQWVAWNNKKEALEAQFQESASKPSLWATYIQRMGGIKFAQGAIQDVMRGKLNNSFHSHYEGLTGRVLHMASTDIAGAQEHLKMTLGEEEAGKLETDRKSQQAKLQKKGGGQFGAGKVGDKLKEAKAAQALAQAEGGAMFDLSETEEPKGDGEAPMWEKPELAPGERYHLGTALENQIHSLMPTASQAFAGRKGEVKVDAGMHMSGKFSSQQRAVKAITQLRRMGLFYGAGSGKTGIMLGALTSLHKSGDCKKSILAVPSVVQAQFGAEAIRFIDPTSGFHVHAQPGESYEERLAAYRDPDKHAVVVTHQTLRDDTLKILGDHLGGGPEKAREFLMATPAKDAAAAVKEAFTKAGIDFSALMVDEAHGALDRDGKADSTLSKVMDAHSHNCSHVVMATGDPLKNDVSEVWSNLNKIDPHKYPQETRDEFIRRYKNDAPLAKKSMAQELSRYWFNGRTTSGKECYRSNPVVPLTAKQKANIEQVELASGKLRTGAKGADAVKWAQILSPKAFEGKPEAEHQAIADRVQKSVGTSREGAMNRIINLDPEGGKIAEHVRIAKERMAEGKPVVIFAHSLEAVAAIHASMEKAGLKACKLTGKDSSAEKGIQAGRFQRGETDVIILSDAGATGLNLQRGKCIIQHDTPATAMCHNQRIARIDRIGQKDNVEAITLTGDHAWERNNWERVKRKGVLGEIFQDPNGYLDDSGLAGDLKAVRARAGQGSPKKEGAA